MEHEFLIKMKIFLNFPQHISTQRSELMFQIFYFNCNVLSMDNEYINIKDIAEVKGLTSTRSLRLQINKKNSPYIAREVEACRVRRFDAPAMFAFCRQTFKLF